MPLDLSMLLSTSQPSYAPLSASPLLDDFLMETDGELPPFACRRVASFPMVNRHFPKPSNLKCRSSSENCLSNGKTSTTTLNGCNMTLQDFKRELTAILETSNDDHNRRSGGGGGGHRRDDINNADVIVVVADSDSGTLSPSTPTNNGKGVKSRRKKVVFADDFGKDLFTVRVMSEPSDVPPKLTSPVVRAILGIGEEFASDIEARPSAQWVLDFAQPASEYLQFRQNIDANNVALENVVVKNDSCRLAGTVKVKNICFEKTVIVRYTDNSWRSYNDRECKYMAPGKSRAGGVGDMYDTFQFDIEIPCDDDTREIMEFCVCFRLDDQREFWDSNRGKNFRIVSEKYRLRQMQNQPTTGQTNGHQSSPGGAGGGQQHRRGSLTRQSSNDAYELDYNNWTEFSSWSDLSTNGPYW